MVELNKEISSIEKGEAWKDTDKVVEIEVNRTLDKVVPVRLSSESWSKLREEARGLGVGPTTLARMWILERLRFEQNQNQDVYGLYKYFLQAGSFNCPLTPQTPTLAKPLYQCEYRDKNAKQKEER